MERDPRRPRQLRPSFVTRHRLVPRHTSQQSRHRASVAGSRWQRSWRSARHAWPELPLYLSSVGTAAVHSELAHHLPGRRGPADPDGWRPARLDRPPRGHRRAARGTHPAERADTDRARHLRQHRDRRCQDDPSPPGVSRWPRPEPPSTGDRPQRRPGARAGVDEPAGGHQVRRQADIVRQRQEWRPPMETRHDASSTHTRWCRRGRSPRTGADFEHCSARPAATPPIHRHRYCSPHPTKFEEPKRSGSPSSSSGPTSTVSAGTMPRFSPTSSTRLHGRHC